MVIISEDRLAKMSKKSRRRARKVAEEHARVFNTDPKRPIEQLDLNAPDSGWPPMLVEEPVPPPEWINTEKPKTPEELEKERIASVTEGWPWEGAPQKLVTLAPYVFNGYNDKEPFALPEAVQNSPLLRVMERNALILRRILHYVSEKHDALWKLAVTSRSIWNLVTREIDIWDMNSGFFNNCDLPRTGPGASHDLDMQGSVASIVVVAPVRSQGERPGYAGQMWNLYTLYKSVYHFADYFRNLQLHRVPFLDIHGLSLLIPKMRNLNVLGIYQCPLIHVGDTMKLLEIIQTDKPKGKEKQISLDFYPNYHIGPAHEPGNPYTVGSYGVTWDNWNCDTRLGLWCLILRVIPQARVQEVDFESPQSMFRQWLEKSPCAKIDETLEAIMSIKTTPGELAAMCDYANYKGSVTKLMSKVPNRAEGWEWSVRYYFCRQCKQEVLGKFFYYGQIRNAMMDGTLNQSPSTITCLGCMLTNYLNSEVDHYKREKRDIIRSWLHSPFTGWNHNNLPKALEDFAGLNIDERAEDLDNWRYQEMHPSEEAMKRGVMSVDHEHNEGQVPLTRDELGRLGKKNRSPEVTEKFESTDQWNSIDKSRLWSHGHGIAW